MHSFKPAARRRGRIPRFLLLSLLVLATAGINPAHADGVTGTISDGQTVTGTITVAFVATVSETGPDDATFVPVIDLVAPGGALGGGSGHPLYARLEQSNAAAGPWTAKVSRGNQGTTGGTYALTIMQVPGASAAVALSPGSPSSGSNTRGQVDVFTFTGVAGQTKTLTLSPTGGDGFIPQVSVYTPAGVSAGMFGCSETCSRDIPITTDGTFTVLAWKQDNNDVTGAYTLSVNDKN